MPDHSYTSRRELEEYRFSPAVALGVPLLFILLQAYVPKIFHRFLILDLPLLAVIFFAVARRNPIVGALTGAAIGLLQDALTGQPIGINGMAKSVIGYIASSIGVQVDVENPITRVLMVFGFSILQSAMLFAIDRVLLGNGEVRLLWVHEVIRAALNTAVAIPLLLFLDRFKLRN
jgi:rod shape-determining protein MreD